MVWTPRQSRMLGTSDGTPATAAISTIQRKVWTQQPQGVVGIDHSNPITCGLVASFNGSSLIDAVTNKLCANNGTTKHVASVVTNGTSSYIQEDFSAQAYVDSVTILVITMPASLPLTMSAVCAFETVNETRGSRYLCVTSDGQWAISQATSDGVNADIFGPVTLGKRSVIVATRDDKPSGSGGVCNWAINGTFGLIGTNASGTPNYGNGVPATRFLVGRGDVSADKYYSGETELCVFWGRVLSNSEITSISANPWQIFAPKSQPIWVPA